MNPLIVGGIAFACLFGGALLGMALSAVLPAHHLNSDSRDAIKLSTAVVATLSALALGLLVASAKTSFDTADNLLRTMVARTVLLDRAMAHYGPETQSARIELRQLVEAQLHQIQSDGRIGGIDPSAETDNRGIEPVQDKLRALTPQTEAQRLLLARALQVSGDIAEARWLMFARSEAGFPWPFLAILVAWLVMLFFSFGLQAPRNPTVFCIVILRTASVASAVFLIVDMQRPLSGYVQVSSAPLRDALDQLGR
jgi:hypothetical protein